MEDKSVSGEQVTAAGADPKRGAYREGQMEAVVEVDMPGQVVGEGCFFQHIAQEAAVAKPDDVGEGKTIGD